MKNEEEKKYVHNGKTIKIIPVRKRKSDIASFIDEEEKAKPARERRTKKSEVAKGQPKYAVGDKVSLKNIPIDLAGAGLNESVVTKVFKSTYDQMYRYTIRSVSGRELPLLKEEQLKPRK